MFEREKTVLFALQACCLIFVADPACAQTWQQSTSLEVSLGVRDKFGQGGNYTVVFAVKEPTGATSSKVAKAKGDEFVSVRFPTDFNTYLKRGRYTWTASVSGRQIATGRFAYEPVEFGERITISHQ